MATTPPSHTSGTSSMEDSEFAFANRLSRGYAMLKEIHNERTAAYLPLLPIYKVCEGEFGLHVPKMALQDPELGKGEVDMVDAYLPRGFEKFVGPALDGTGGGGGKAKKRVVLQKRDLKLRCLMMSKRAAEDMGVALPTPPPSSEKPRTPAGAGAAARASPAAPPDAHLHPSPPAPTSGALVPRPPAAGAPPTADRPSSRPGAAGAAPTAAATYPLRDPEQLLQLYDDGDSMPSERIASFFSFKLGTQSPIRMYLDGLAQRRIATGKETFRRSTQRAASPMLMSQQTNAEAVLAAGHYAVHRTLGPSTPTPPSAGGAVGASPSPSPPPGCGGDGGAAGGARPPPLPRVLKPYSQLDGFLPLELFDPEPPRERTTGWMMKPVDSGDVEWMPCEVAGRDPTTLFYEVVVAADARVIRTSGKGYPTSPSLRHTLTATPPRKSSAERRRSSRLSIFADEKPDPGVAETFGHTLRRPTLSATEGIVSTTVRRRSTVAVYTRLVSRYYLRFDDESIEAFFARVAELKARRSEAERVFRTEFLISNMRDDVQRGLPDELINAVLEKSVQRMPKVWEGRIMQYLHQACAEHHHAMRRARYEYFLLSPVFRAQIQPLGVIDAVDPPVEYTHPVPKDDHRKSRYRMARDVVEKCARLTTTAHSLLLHMSHTWVKVAAQSLLTLRHDYIPPRVDTPPVIAVNAVVAGKRAGKASIGGDDLILPPPIEVGPLHALDFRGFVQNQERHATKTIQNAVFTWKNDLDMHITARLQKKHKITRPLPEGHPLHKFVRLVNLRAAACLRDFAMASIKEYLGYLEGFLPSGVLDVAHQASVLKRDSLQHAAATAAAAFTTSSITSDDPFEAFQDVATPPALTPKRDPAGQRAGSPGALDPRPTGLRAVSFAESVVTDSRSPNASAAAAAGSPRRLHNMAIVSPSSRGPAIVQRTVRDMDVLRAEHDDASWRGNAYDLCGMPPMMPRGGQPLLTLRIDAILVDADGFCAEETKRVDYQTPLVDVRGQLGDIARMMVELVSHISVLEEPVPTAVRRKAPPSLEVFLDDDPFLHDALERISMVFDVFEPRLMEILAHYRRLESAFQTSFVDITLFSDMCDTRDVVDKLESLEAARTSVATVSPDNVFIGCFMVDCALVKRQLTASYTLHMDRYLQHIETYLHQTSSNACALYEKLWAALQQRPTTPEDYESFKTLTDALLAQLRETEKTDFEKVEKWRVVLDRFRWSLANSTFTRVYTMRRWPLKIKAAVEASNTQLVNEGDEFVAALKRDIEVLHFDLTQARQMIKKLFTLHDYDQAEIAAGRAKQISQLLDNCLQRSQRVTSHERIFKLPLTDWSAIEMLVERTTPIIDVWLMAHEWMQLHPRFTDSTFDTLDMPMMKKKVVEWRRAFRIVVRALRGYQMPQSLGRRLELEVATFQTQLVWVEKLLGNGVRVRHWKMLRLELGIAPDVDLTIGVLLKAGVEKNLKFVDSLAEQAARESDIESSLETMQAEWKDRKLNLTEWGGRCMLALSELFDHLALIDKHVMNTQLLRGMQGISFFEKVARDWEEQLTRLQTALSLWHTVQDMWMALRPIFENERVCGEVEREAKQFMRTDKLWVKMMREGAAVVRVIALPEDFGNRLKDVSASLVQIKQGLVEFLNTRRQKWPRLFWLTDNVILDMISSSGGSGGSVRIESHLATCFEGVARLTSNDDGDIISMSSRGGEVVRFTDPVRRLHQSIDVWLSDVERRMRETLPQLLEDALGNMFDMLVPEWLDHWPAQVILLALRIAEHEDTEELLAFSGTRGLAALKKKHTRHMEEVTARMQQTPPATTREKMFYEALLAHHLMFRDRATQLAAQEVASTTDFGYAIALKHTIAGNDREREREVERGTGEKDADKLPPGGAIRVNVSAGHMSLPYQWEYLGEYTSLIATPITERLQRMMLVAFACGSPVIASGPSGVGKTHITKDLALQLGVKAIAVDVSPSLLWSTLINTLCGAVAVGAWCILSSLELASDAVMAKLGPTLIHVYKAHEHSAAHIEFGEVLTDRADVLKLKLAPQVLVSATRNHVHNAPISSVLKELFRPVTLNAPDLGVVCAHMLMLGGCVQYAEEFAGRLMLVLRTADGMIPLPSPMTMLRKIYKTMMLVNFSGTLDRGADGEAAAGTTVEWAEYQLLANVFYLCTAPVLSAEEFAVVRGLFEKHFQEFGEFLHPNRVRVPHAALHSLPAGGEIELVDGPPVPVTDRLRTTLELLAQQLALNRSVILSGAAGCGKSTLLSALAACHHAGARPTFHTLVPTAMPIATLCGRLGADGRWEAGVLPKLLRRIQNAPVWLVFDGGMGEVYHRFLTLMDDAVGEYHCISGENLALSPKSKVIMETLSLRDASPAVVSRAGLFILSHEADWRLVFKRTLAEFASKVNAPVLQQFRSQISGMLETVVPPVRAFAEEFVPDAEPFRIVIRRVAILFLGLFAQVNSFPDSVDAVRCFVEVPMVHAVITVLLSPLPDEHLAKLHDTFPTWTELWGGTLQQYLPPYTTPLECYPSDGKWVKIIDHPIETALQPPVHISCHSREFYQPLPNSIRVVYLSEVLAPFHIPLVILGGPLSGKTTLVNLIRTRSDAQFLSVAVSTSTKAGGVQGFVESRLTKRRHGVSGPPFGKQCMLVLEDLHLPDAAPAAPDSVFELLTSLFKYKKWYDSNATSIDVVDVDVLGTHVTDYGICPRLQPLMFPLHLYRELTVPMCTGVVSAILHGWAGKYSAGLANALADIIVGTWDFLTKAFPADTGNLYLWSVEDVFSVARAVALHPRDLYKQRHVALSLTVSMLFTICARFTTREPVAAMDKKIVELMERHMRVHFSESALAPSQLVFTTLDNVDECFATQAKTADVIAQVQQHANLFLKEHLKNFKGLYGIQEMDECHNPMSIMDVAMEMLAMSPSTATALKVTQPAELAADFDLTAMTPAAPHLLASPTSMAAGSDVGSPKGSPHSVALSDASGLSGDPTSAASQKKKKVNPFLAAEQEQKRVATAKRHRLLTALKTASKVVVHQQQQPLVINEVWAGMVSQLVMALKHPKRHAVVVSDQGDSVRSLALLATYITGMKVIVDVDQSLPEWGDRLDQVIRKAALAQQDEEFVWVLHESMMNDTAVADLSLMMATDTCMLIRPNTLRQLQDHLVDEATTELALYVQRKTAARLHCVLLCNSLDTRNLVRWKRHFPSLFYSPFVIVGTSASDTRETQVRLATTTFKDTLRFDAELAEKTAAACHAVYTQHAKEAPSKSRPYMYRQLITTFCRIYSARHELLEKRSKQFMRVMDLIECCRAQGKRDQEHADALAQVLLDLDGQRKGLVEKAEMWGVEVQKKQSAFKELESSCVEKVQSHAQTRAECDRMMKEAIPAMERARDALSVLTDNQISAVRFLAVPAPNVKKVMEAICLALGRRMEKQTRAVGSADLAWKLSQSVLADPDFVHHVQQVQPERLPPSVLDHLKRCLEDKGFSPEKLRGTGLTAIELLCEYLCRLHDYLLMKSVVLPKQTVLLEDDEHIKGLVKQMEKRRQDTVAARKQVHLYQRKIDTLESRHAAITTFRDGAVLRKKNCDLFLKAIEPMEAQWASRAKKLCLDLEILASTCVITAAMLVYYPFSLSEKRTFVREVYRHLPEPPSWKLADIEGVSVAEILKRDFDCDLVDVLGGHDDIEVSIVEEVLPNTAFHREQACACSHTLKCPVFIDPYGAALKFLQAQYAGSKLVVAGNTGWSDVIVKCMTLGMPVVVLIEDITQDIALFARMKVNGYGQFHGSSIAVKKGFHMFFIRKESSESGGAWFDRQGEYIREFVTLFDFRLDDADVQQLACFHMAFAVDEQTQTLYSTRLRQHSSAHRYARDTYRMVEAALFTEAKPEVLWQPDSCPEAEVVLPTADLSVPVVPLPSLPTFLSNTHAVHKVVEGLKNGAEADERTANYKIKLGEARQVIVNRFGPLARQLLAVHNAVMKLTKVHGAYGSSFLFLLLIVVVELRAGTDTTVGVAQQYTTPLQAWDADPEHIRAVVFHNVCKLLSAGMLAKHRPVFAFLVALELNRHRAVPQAHAITDEEWALFHDPPCVRHGTSWDDKARPWMRHVMEVLRALSVRLPCFLDLPHAFEYDPEGWVAVMCGSELPVSWQHRLTPFQLLILRRALNPDALPQALSRFASVVSVNQPTDRPLGPVALLRDALLSRAATPDVPLLFLTDRAEPGSSRMELERIAWSMGGSNIVTVPYTPGPPEAFFKAVDMHIKASGVEDPTAPDCMWVLIAGVTKYPAATILALKHHIELMGRPGAGGDQAQQTQYKFFAEADIDACAALPPSFIYRAIKLVAPTAIGMTQQLQKGLEIGPVMRRHYAQPDQPGRGGYHQLLWVCTLFHAGLVERQRFGTPYGWLQEHRWDEGDLKEMIAQVARVYRGMVQAPPLPPGRSQRRGSLSDSERASGALHTRLLQLTRFLIEEVVYDMHAEPLEAARAMSLFNNLIDVCTGVEYTSQIGVQWIAPKTDHQEQLLSSQRLSERPARLIHQVAPQMQMEVSRCATGALMAWVVEGGRNAYNEAAAAAGCDDSGSGCGKGDAAGVRRDCGGHDDETVVDMLLDAAVVDPPRHTRKVDLRLPSDAMIQTVIRRNEVALHMKQVAMLRRQILYHDAEDPRRFVDVPPDAAKLFPSHMADVSAGGRPLIRLLQVLQRKWEYLRVWEEEHPRDLWLLACAHPRSVLTAFTGKYTPRLRGICVANTGATPEEVAFRLIHLNLGCARLNAKNEIVPPALDTDTATGVLVNPDAAVAVGLLPDTVLPAAGAHATVPVVLGCDVPRIGSQQHMDHVCSVEIPAEAGANVHIEQRTVGNPFFMSAFNIA